MAKDKKDKKGKKDKGEEPGGLATLTSHPRASRDLLRARAWGALLGFAVVAWLSFGAGAAPADVVLRAIIGGTVGQLVGWGACVVAWRSLAHAEIRAANAAYEAAVREHAEAHERTLAARQPAAA